VAEGVVRDHRRGNYPPPSTPSPLSLNLGLSENCGKCSFIWCWKTFLTKLMTKFKFWAFIINPVENLQCLSENDNFLSCLLFYPRVRRCLKALQRIDLGHRTWTVLGIWSWGKGSGHMRSNNVLCVWQMLARREGGVEGKLSRAPRRLGPRRRSKILEYTSMRN